MNYAAMAIDFHARPGVITRRSPADAYNDDGELVPRPPTTIQARIVVEPLPGHKRQDLPEGLRDQADYAFWSRKEILLDDEIEHMGSSYRVLYLKPRWEGSFHRAVGCKLR